MAGRLYRMAKVVSANPASWGIVDAKEISGFRRVSKLTDLYSIAECILSSAYGDGTTDGVDAVGQIWYVAETNADYKLTNWSNRKSASGWTKLSYGGDVSVPVKDVQVNGTTVLSGGVAKIDLTEYATIEGVNTTFTSHGNRLTTLESTAENHEKRIKANETNIAANKSDIKNINDKIGAKSGIATLDANGYVPLSQLGNLDMTVFTVVEELPTSNIENKVYLLKATTVGDKNNYAEYIYTGDRKGTYDATKWEKLGEVAAKVDLSDYMTAQEVTGAIESTQSTIEDDYNGKFDTVQTNITSINNSLKTKAEITTVKAKDISFDPKTGILSKGDGDGNTKTTLVSLATNETPGFMSTSDKSKLDTLVQTDVKDGDESVTDTTYSKKTILAELAKKVSTTTANNTYATKTALETLSTTVSNIKQFNVVELNSASDCPLLAFDPETGNAVYRTSAVFQYDSNDDTVSINADNFQGTASKAIADKNGKDIDTTYAKKTDLSNYWATTDLVALTDTELDTILK